MGRSSPRRSPAVLLIPGNSSPEHLRDNLAALDIALTEEQYQALG
jgi:aryl-alcohol dehydrogenase-like predicted oxidoreductase